DPHDRAGLVDHTAGVRGRLEQALDLALASLARGDVATDQVDRALFGDRAQVPVHPATRVAGGPHPDFELAAADSGPDPSERGLGLLAVLGGDQIDEAQLGPDVIGPAEQAV